MATEDELTEIACIVDRSGSMYELKDDAIGGFNQFVEEQLELEGGAHITLTLFNHETDIVYTSKPVDQVDPLDEDAYQPGGMTALMDAVGQTIERLEDGFEERDGVDPDHVIVLILTDGKENSSRDFDRRDIAEMIGERDEREGWEFVFWGANINAPRVAERLNIKPGNVSQFEATGEGLEEAFGEMSMLTESFRESGILDEELKKLAEDEDGDDSNPE